MNWKLTQAAIGRPEIDTFHDEDSPEDLRRGFSLLAELARADETLVEIAPGVWRHSKSAGETALLRDRVGTGRRNGEVTAAGSSVTADGGT